MIYGIGTDIVDSRRISTIYSKKPDRFVEKLLSKTEIQQFNAIDHPHKKVLYLVNRWIAKEAVVKAFGTGLRKGIYFAEISIINDKLGKPLVVLSESANKIIQNILQAQQLKPNFRIHLSLSHEVNYATSMAVVELT